MIEVALAAIKPNPFRQLDKFPLDQARVALLRKSIHESLAGRSVEEIAVKPAPEIVWYLIGIPLERFGQVQQHVAALEGIAEIAVQSSRKKESAA